MPVFEHVKEKAEWEAMGMKWLEGYLGVLWQWKGKTSLPNRQGGAEKFGELGFAGGAGGEFGDAVLGEGALDEGGDVGFGVADGGEAVGHF